MVFWGLYSHCIATELELGFGFGLGGHEGGEAFFQPGADFFLLYFFVDVGVDVHGDVDGAVAKLALDVFEVEAGGVFHAAGHVVAEHVEGRAYAQLPADAQEVVAEVVGADGGAVPLAGKLVSVRSGAPC